MAKVFAGGQAAGLFALATERIEGALPPSFVFWRDFAARYLTALCHTPETSPARNGSISRRPRSRSGRAGSRRPADARHRVPERSRRLLAVWDDLDPWVRDEMAHVGEALSGFLKRRAPLWHQVGRVCFHLAENRRDERHRLLSWRPMRPGWQPAARVQYQPLSHALRELAGAKNKKALIHLLSPVQLASERSAW